MYVASMTLPRRRKGQGPSNPEQVRSGDAYELSEGHAIYCAPTGGDGGGPNGRGFLVIDSDPKVKTAGVDTGFQLSPLTMRAPGVSAGDFSECPGWVQGGSAVGDRVRERGARRARIA